MNIQINQGDLFRVHAMLSGIKNGVPRVIMRSVNKTMPGVRTDIVAEVRKSQNVKAGAVRKQIKVNKASVTDLRASVDVGRDAFGRPVYGRGLGLPIIGYSGPRQTKKGVTVEIRKGQGRKLVKGAFVATMKSGHKGVFKRRGSSRLRDRVEPIKELFTTSVPDALSNGPALATVMVKGQVRLDKNINHETDYLLSQI